MSTIQPNTSPSPERSVEPQPADNSSSDDSSSNDDSSSSSSDDDQDITERTDIPETMQPHIERLKQLRQRITESSQLNKREMYQEHQRSHENPRTHRKHEQKRREAQILKHRDEYTGDDYERSRFMDYSIEQVEKYNERKRERAENVERGFTDYAQVNQRKYERDVAKIKPDLLAYQSSRNKEGQEVDSRAVQRLADHVVDQQSRRAKLHKPSVEKEGEEVSYINQKNARFNRKMDRAYDKHTKDIRDNLERGTA
ncbi:pre-mRNA-splicing factor SYF2, partial [Coemansia sp. RSA 2618]